MARRPSDQEQPIYVISVAAELAGVHPQTLRIYERKGLVSPKRTSGNTRRYSERDIDHLRKIQQLTQEGVNLAGVVKIIGLERELEALRHDHAEALEEIDRLSQRMQKVLKAREATSLVPFKDIRRVRRAMKSDALDRAGRRRVFTAPAVVEKESRN
jgi:MerR family transcriptional regulator/heat shock protein HspR